MRLFIYILSVLVFIEADDNVSEPRETVNPTTPIHNVSEPRETVNPTTPIRTKRSAESSKLGEISPAIFHAQEVRTAEGTKNIINSFSTPGGTHFQYEIEGTPVGGESSEQRRARKKANTQRKERVELRAGAKKGYLPSIEKSTEKKNIESARKAAARAAEPNDVAEARKLQDSAQHAAKRAAAPGEVTEARKLQDSAQHAAKRAREKAAKIKAEADALKKQRAEENAARNRKLHESLSEEGEKALLAIKRAFDHAHDIVPRIPHGAFCLLSAPGNADNLSGILDMTTAKATLDVSSIATAPTLISGRNGDDESKLESQLFYSPSVPQRNVILSPKERLMLHASHESILQTFHSDMASLGSEIATCPVCCRRSLGGLLIPEF